MNNKELEIKQKILDNLAGVHIKCVNNLPNGKRTLWHFSPNPQSQPLPIWIGFDCEGDRHTIIFSTQLFSPEQSRWSELDLTLGTFFDKWTQQKGNRLTSVASAIYLTTEVRCDYSPSECQKCLFDYLERITNILPTIGRMFGEDLEIFETLKPMLVGV